MQTNQAGLQLLKSFEGLRLKPYLCSAKVPTIGFGATTYQNGMKVQLTDPPITVQAAEDLLKHHLKQFEQAVDSAISVTLNENQFSALVSLCYNIGPGNFKKSTLVMLIEKGSLEDAAKQFLVWNKAGGQVVDGLTRRREAEKKLFETPVKDQLPPIPTTQEINDKLAKIEEEAKI